MNPIFPLDETVADPEVHLFQGRLWLYGSHDLLDGSRYCPGDYEAFSCDADLSGGWRSEGVIYRRDQDPANQDGTHDLYAPDVAFWHGRYYLFYALSGVDAISAAVSEAPQGPFEYLGKVRCPAGTDIGSLPELPSFFDPSVLVDQDHLWLAFGFSYEGEIPGMDLSERRIGGGYAVELEEDALTMKTLPKCMIPGVHRAAGTSFEHHPFLEAASLRRYGDFYYYVYSSQAQHELCYARSRQPDQGYAYAGILISNAGKLADSDPFLSNHANNHGCLAQIGDRFAVFYHRHTCGTQYSRQVCAEWIGMRQDGFLDPVRPTAAGLEEDIPHGVDLPAAYASAVADLPEGAYIPFEGLEDHAMIHGGIIRQIRNSEIRWAGLRTEITGIRLVLEGHSGGQVSALSEGSVLQCRQVPVQGRTEVRLRWQQPVNGELTIRLQGFSEVDMISACFGI